MASQPPIPDQPASTPVDSPVPTPVDPVPATPSDPVVPDPAGHGDYPPVGTDPLHEGP